MFTGIIEALGIVKGLEKEGENLNLTIESPISTELKIDQSVAHNGVCLTVTQVNGNTHQITAVKETLEKTNLNDWHVGDLVNLERAMQLGDRLDGHIVQGHVDTTLVCINRSEQEGSHLFTFQFDPKFGGLLIEKGSACINGVSLTTFDVKKDHFSVTIIPYTFSHTNFSKIKAGNRLNIEFDILGKYILRQSMLKEEIYVGA